MEQNQFIINPRSNFGQLMLQYYGTTDLDTIAKLDDQEQCNLQEKLNDLEKVTKFVCLSDLPKVKYTRQQKLFDRFFDNNQFDIRESDVISKQQQRQIIKQARKVLKSNQILVNQLNEHTEQQETLYNLHIVMEQLINGCLKK